MGLSKHPTCSLQKDTKMSTHTIETSHRIAFGCHGSIELVGLQCINGGTISQKIIGATILLTQPIGLMLPSEELAERIAKHLDSTVKKFSSLDGKEDKLFFSVKANRSIQSPRKFLRSIRNKLNGISRPPSMEEVMAQEEFEVEAARRAHEMVFGS